MDKAALRQRAERLKGCTATGGFEMTLIRITISGLPPGRFEPDKDTA